MANELNRLVNQFFYGSDARPNPEPEQEIIDKGALLTSFLVEFQISGGDISRFTEDEWRRMLIERFEVDRNDVGDYIDQLSQWGVVDNLDQ